MSDNRIFHLIVFFDTCISFKVINKDVYNWDKLKDSFFNPHTLK